MDSEFVGTQGIIIRVWDRHLRPHRVSPVSEVIQELSGRFGAGVDQIHGFADVLFQIVELDTAVVIMLDQFVFALTDGSCRGACPLAGGKVPIQGVAAQ
jgi:hypothetical protein